MFGFLRRFLEPTEQSECPHHNKHNRLSRPLTPDRLNPDNVQLPMVERLHALADGEADALLILTTVLRVDPETIYDIDSKRLYGARIVQLYGEVCGWDLDRFIYHVGMELPNQETGQLSTAGKYARYADRDFLQKRMCGEPGSFWALAEPPTNRRYEYPIV